MSVFLPFYCQIAHGMAITHFLSTHQLMDIWVLATFTCVFIPVGYRPGVELSRHMGTLFNLTRNDQTVFQSSCVVSVSDRSVWGFQFSPNPHQHLYLADFLILRMLVCGKQHLTMALICISLITNDAEHPFVCLLAARIFSLEKCLCKAFARFLIGLSVIIVCYFWVVRVLYVVCIQV